MATTTTMTVQQGKCEIYPRDKLQLCTRIRVLVLPLKPDEEFEWIGGETVRDVDITCSEDGLDRLLRMIDNGTTAPTLRPRKAKGDANKGE